MEFDFDSEPTAHKQILVRVNDQEAQIDKKIAPLIREIWTAGIATMFSCQDYRGWSSTLDLDLPGGRVFCPNEWPLPRGWVWIEFLDGQDVREFLNIISANSGRGWARKRMIGNGRSFEEMKEGAWRYDIRVQGTETRWMLCPVDVWFPRKDLPAVVSALKKHNKKHEANKNSKNQ